jgi:hypothetical protein
MQKFNQESKSSSGFGRRIAMIPFSSEKHQQARFHPPILGRVDFVECVKHWQHGKNHPAVDHARSGQQEREIRLRFWRVAHHSLQLCVKESHEGNKVGEKKKKEFQLRKRKECREKQCREKQSSFSNYCAPHAL